ncbi:MAG: hypothetical protein E7599_05425 [Ruminococcaceae bacterium]|nr:hypothetical protein [Oscillospiraceae bacterium]
MNHPSPQPVPVSITKVILSASQKIQTEYIKPHFAPARSLSRRYRLQHITTLQLSTKAYEQICFLLNKITIHTHRIKLSREHQYAYNDILAALRLISLYLVSPSTDSNEDHLETLILYLSMRLTQSASPLCCIDTNQSLFDISNHIRRLCILKEQISYRQL